MPDTLPDAQASRSGFRVPLNSFRSRIITIVLIVFIPVILLVLLNSQLEQQQAVQLAQNDALDLAYNLASENEQHIETARELLVTLTELPAVRERNPAECTPIFERFRDALPRYTGIFAVDASTHTVYCSSRGNTSTEPLDFAQFPWYAEALNADDLIISEFRIASISGQPVVTFAYPLFDENGQLIAVIAANLSLEWMNRYIADRVDQLPANTTFTLLDDSGQTLVRYPDDLALIGELYPLVEVREAALSNSSGTLTTTGFDGLLRLYSYFEVPVGSRKLHAIVSVPQAAALQEAQEARNRTLIAVIGIAAGGMLFAWIASGLLIQPIQSLIGVSRQIARGQVSSRTRLTSDIIELRDLLSSFNEMAEQVEVDQRTRIDALAQANHQLRDQIAERAAAERRNTILNDLAVALSEALTSDQVANAVIDKGLRPIGGNTAAITIAAGNKAQLHVLARCFGDAPPTNTQIPFVPLDPPSPFTDAYMSGKTIWISSRDQLRADYARALESGMEESLLSGGAYVPLHIGKTVIGVLYMGSPADAPIADPQKDMLLSIASYCAQALERARLFESERQAREDIERTLSRIQQLQQTTAALSRAVTPLEIGRILLEQGARYLGTQSGTIYLLDEQHEQFKLLHHLNPRSSVEDQAKWRHFPLDPQYPMGWAVIEKQPLWFSSISEVYEHFPAVAGIFSITEKGGHAIIPLLLGGEALGAISFNFTDSRSFDEETRNLVVALTYLCAQALERARLTEQAKLAAAQEAAAEERARLARDLHDAVSQTLFSATNFAEALPKQWERDPKRAMELLDQLVILNRAAMAEMRSLLFELRPEAVMKTRLSVLFMQLINAAKGRRVIDAQLHIDGVHEADELGRSPLNGSPSGVSPLQLPPNVHFAFYRIAQECVTNILKHSSATAFEIELSQENGIVRLTVSDNGQGFEIVDSDTGFGLENMRERAASIGASLEIDSAPGAGTRISVTWDSTKQMVDESNGEPIDINKQGIINSN